MTEQKFYDAYSDIDGNQILKVQVQDMLKFRHTVISRILGLGLLFGAIQSAQAACPADIMNLAPGTWCEVPNSHMNDVAFQWPAGVTYTQNGLGVTCVIDCWSGGAYDTKRDRLIVWGGGHFGYAGNEIYAFDVNAQKWIRVNSPSIPVGEDTPYAPDGGPTSRHTYDYVEYVPSTDRFCSFGGAGFYSSGQTATTNTDCFNFDTLTWEHKTPIASIGDKGTTIGGKAVYDPVTQKVYYQSGLGGAFSSYDPATDTWQVLDSASYMDYYLTVAIDPVRRKMIAVGYGQQLIFDLNNPSAGYTNLSTSGDPTIINAQAPGIAYDPVSDKFVGWAGGANVYTLNLDTLVWTQATLSGSNTVTPTAANSDGTYGRFRYIPSKNAYIVVNSINEDVFFYKLASGQSTPPQAPAKPTLTIK